MYAADVPPFIRLEIMYSLQLNVSQALLPGVFFSKRVKILESRQFYPEAYLVFRDKVV